MLTTHIQQFTFYISLSIYVLFTGPFKNKIIDIYFIPKYYNMTLSYIIIKRLYLTNK